MLIYSKLIQAQKMVMHFFTYLYLTFFLCGNLLGSQLVAMPDSNRNLKPHTVSSIRSRGAPSKGNPWTRTPKLP